MDLLYMFFGDLKKESIHVKRTLCLFIILVLPTHSFRSANVLFINVEGDVYYLSAKSHFCNVDPLDVHKLNH